MSWVDCELLCGPAWLSVSAHGPFMHGVARFRRLRQAVGFLDVCVLFNGSSVLAVYVFRLSSYCLCFVVLGRGRVVYLVRTFTGSRTIP